MKKPNLKPIRVKHSWCENCKAWRRFYVMQDQNTGVIVYLCSVCKFN